MSYTFIAVACYIVLRSLQVLFEDQAQERWFKTLIRTVAVIVLYSGLAAIIIWYVKIPLLGFDPSK